MTDPLADDRLPDPQKQKSLQDLFTALFDSLAGYEQILERGDDGLVAGVRSTALLRTEHIAEFESEMRQHRMQVERSSSPARPAGHRCTT